jgi:hypothetical protein
MSGSRLSTYALFPFLLVSIPSAAFGRDNQPRKLTLTTIADARSGVGESVDLGRPGASPGDMFVFDQPLLDTGDMPIGANAGFCIRTMPGQFSECQWTLTMAKGSITVAGREAELGTSLIPVIGGTGEFACVAGVLTTTPKGDKTYEQKLTLYWHSDCAEQRLKK